MATKTKSAKMYLVVGIPSYNQHKKGLTQLHRTTKSLSYARKLAVKFIGKDPKSEVSIYLGDHIGYHDENRIHRIRYYDKFNTYLCDNIDPIEKRWLGIDELDSDGKIIKPKKK